MPINEPYNPASDPAVNPFAKRGNDVIKRFVSPASSVSGGGNGVTSLDDPTYLGFSLRFDISSPLFNGATNGEPPRPPSESPVFDALGESVANGLAPPNQEPALAVEVSKPIQSGESAVGYLNKVGETTRASRLMYFIQGLREVNEIRPYYWQTISGLTEAWSRSLNMKDPFQGSAEGEGITIGCLEAIDLKISALFNLYKAAVYDVAYRRMVLPTNLMYFRVEVDIFEIRRFKVVENWLQKLNPNTPPNDVERFLNDNTSKITFVFDDCKWVPEESGKVFEGVTNAGGNEKTVTSMKWEYGSISMKADFSGIDQELNDKSKNQTKGNLGTAVKDAVKQQALKAAGSAADRLAKRIGGLVKGVVLGNVFGLRNQIFAALQNPGALSSAVEGALIQRPSTPGGNIRLGDNPLGTVIQPSKSLPSDNLFPGKANQSFGLNSSNVFGRGPSGPPPLNPNNIFE